MKLNGSFAAGATLALAGLLVGAPAQAVNNGDEMICQLGTAITLGKFEAKKMSCIASCWGDAFGGGNPADCVPPYGGATFGCINSAENGTNGAIQKKCNQDCPECYTGGDCPADRDARIAAMEAHVEALAADVFCDDSGSGDGLTVSELKCQVVVAKAVTKFGAKKLKCYARCRKLEVSGKIPAGSCTPPAADPKTSECIAKYETKTALIIGGKCLDEPECGSYPANDGAAWIAAEEAAVDAEHASLFCND
jgi:hypothetical protein